MNQTLINEVESFLNQDGIYNRYSIKYDIAIYWNGTGEALSSLSCAKLLSKPESKNHIFIDESGGQINFRKKNIKKVILDPDEYTGKRAAEAEAIEIRLPGHLCVYIYRKD